MERSTARDGETDGLTYAKVQTEFEWILQENDRTAAVGASQSATTYSRTKWWKERTELDQQLQSLLQNIESGWLGGFKGIFDLDTSIDEHDDDFRLFSSTVSKVVVDSLASKQRVKLPQLHPDLCRIILLLGPEPDPSDVEDVLYYLLDTMQFAGHTVAYDEINIDSIEGRLSDAIRTFYLSKRDAPPQTAPSHIVLVLDKFARLQRGGEAALVDPDSLSFVLNPEGDLPSTEAQFSKLLDRYFGHGGGEQFVRSQKVRKLERCAVSFLMGCSSGRLKPAGEFDPSGIALSYVIAGCPALVANLWDVTDRDLDRFSADALSKWGLIRKEADSSAPQRRHRRSPTAAAAAATAAVTDSGHETKPSICEAVAAARDACRMKYLVGAAPVVYGVPVYLRNQPNDGALDTRAFVRFYPTRLAIARNLSVQSSAMWNYPTPRRDDTVETPYPGGAKVKDPYRALEDPDAEVTKEFVRQENEVFQGFLKDSPFRAKLHDRLTELFNYERFGCPFRRGAHYYYFHNSGLQPQSVLYRKATLDAPPETFFDPNTLSEDGTVSLSTYGFTEDGSFFAYALSSGGSDWVRIFVKDTSKAEGEPIDGPIEWVKFTSISWTHDNKGFFYNKYPKPEKLTTEDAGKETDSSKNQM
ncbi:hypothetical protein HK405_011012, partial [Cladochytrium tenue]